jgi:hypothetical protein
MICSFLRSSRLVVGGPLPPPWIEELWFRFSLLVAALHEKSSWYDCMRETFFTCFLPLTEPPELLTGSSSVPSYWAAWLLLGSSLWTSSLLGLLVWFCRLSGCIIFFKVVSGLATKLLESNFCATSVELALFKSKFYRAYTLLSLSSFILRVSIQNQSVSSNTPY